MSEIDLKCAQLEGIGVHLGQPKTDELVCPDGVGHYRHYQAGSIYWHPDAGAFVVKGSILAAFARLDWEKSFLGYPTTDEGQTPDGMGCFNHFQGGSIYWTQATGAHSVRGEIRKKWQVLGWEQSRVGYPVADEEPWGAGRFSRFQRGDIYWSQQTGAHVVYGEILRRYLSMGGPESYLGYPITDEDTDGNARFSQFEHGWIYWTGSFGSADTPHRVHGGRVFTGLVETEGGYPVFDWRQLRAWTAASPTTYLYRRNVVENAFIENQLGLKMPEAWDRYCSGGFPEGSGGWCSELAHYILLMNKGGVQNIKALGTDLGSAYTVGAFKLVFSLNNLWVPTNQITKWTIEPGDYLATQHGGHSTIVVGVKWDRTELWTVERVHEENNDHVGFWHYPYVRPDGTINPEFAGVGKLHCRIVDPAACIVESIPLNGPDATGDTMWPGDVLRLGNSLTSKNGKYTLTYQADGNLVLYRNSNREGIWASDTEGMPAGSATMQTDGNIVIHDTVLNPIWWRTSSPGSRLTVQNDGNLVAYGSNNKSGWASGTDE